MAHLDPDTNYKFSLCEQCDFSDLKTKSAGIDNLISARARGEHALRGGSKSQGSKLPSLDHHSNIFALDAHSLAQLGRGKGNCSMKRNYCR